MRALAAILRNVPRPNKQRTIGAEDRLRERIAVERKARGWSYETMAEAMTEAGCSIHSSAVYKMEKGNPPRRITVNELVALSEVWAIPVERLIG